MLYKPIRFYHVIGARGNFLTVVKEFHRVDRFVTGSEVSQRYLVFYRKDLYLAIFLAGCKHFCIGSESQSSYITLLDPVLEHFFLLDEVFLGFGWVK